MFRRIAAPWLCLALLFSSVIIIIEIAPTANANWIYVDDSGGADYTTIQEAIDTAIDGDTVYVYSGTYYENVIVDKTINLVGEDRDTTLIDGGDSGCILQITEDYVNVSEFTTIDSGDGIYDAGISLSQVENCTIFNMNTSNNKIGILLWYSDNNIIESNIAQFNNIGIEIYNSDGNAIFENNAYHNFVGIGFYFSSENDVNNNIVSSSFNYGIYLDYCDSHYISTNDVFDNPSGILLTDSNENTIISNNAEDNGNGIYLDNSNRNYIEANILFNNRAGIRLGSSSGNNIIDNTMNENGILISGNQIEYWNTHNIDTSNVVNSKPVFYWKNQTGGSIPEGAGQVILANCTNIRIENQEIAYASAGIQLGFSSYNIMTGNNVSFNYQYGMYLVQSLWNSITFNDIFSNHWYGIYLYNSSWNTISRNNATFNEMEGGIKLLASNNNNLVSNNASNNYDGISLSSSNQNKLMGNIISSNYNRGSSLYSSTGNNITGNTLLTNGYRGIFLDSSYINNINNNNVSSNNRTGIFVDNSDENIFEGNNVSSNGQTAFYLTDSYDNLIFHNNIMNNGNQANDDTVNGNQWDSGYPSGGNYWDDYTGFDNLSGPNQDQIGSDGMGDTDYHIDGNSIDNYPLMIPLGYKTIPDLVHNIDTDEYFSKIQSAINDSDTLDGHTIEVSTGIYFENLVISKTINMDGEVTENTIINGGGNGDVVYINAPWVNLTGFTIMESGSEISEAGIQLNGVNNCSIYNNTILKNSDGIFLYSSNENYITDTVLENNKFGIYLLESDDNIIKSNVALNNIEGIYILKSTNNDIINSNFTFNDRYGINIWLSHWNNVSYNNISNNKDGIHIYGGENNRILGNTILSNDELGIYLYDADLNNNISFNTIWFNQGGIRLYSSSQNSINYNNISHNYGLSIFISYGGRNNITNNHIYKNYNGISLSESYSNQIIANNILSNEHNGIEIQHCSWLNIAHNNISNHEWYGIYLSDSSGDNIWGNRMVGNGLELRGDMLWFWNRHNIDISNTVNDKPLYYIKNQTGGVVPLDAGQVILVNCSNIILEGQKLTKVSTGIQLGYSSNCTITQNNISLTRDYGINLWQSHDNNITNNYLKENGGFIKLEDSSRNRIYHNCFIQNYSWPYDNRGDNYWDNGYPYGGNYWSNYTGLDEFQGSNQDQMGSDGLGDTPYIIYTDSQDNYPLMQWPYRDYIHPTIKLNSPFNNSIVRAGNNIEINVIDPNLADVTYSINDGPHQILNSPFEIETIGWVDGNYMIKIHASDTYNNENSILYNFTFDSSAPNIVLNSTQNNTFVHGEINFTISDTNLNLTSYLIDDGPIYNFFKPYIIDTNAWVDGEYKVTIYADDLAGNYNEKWFHFTKDSTFPIILLKSHENNSLLLQTSNIDFEVMDINLDSVIYSRNQGSFITLEEPYDLDASDWDDGEHIIKIRARDEAGNEIQKWFVFIIDTSNPTVVSPSIDDGSMNVPVDTEITIEFSKPMDITSVESAISISPHIEYTCSWNNNKTMTLKFSKPLEYDTSYKISISTEAKDLGGKGLDDRFELEFTTGPKSKDKGEEGLPLMYLILSLIMAIIVALLIVFMALAKKRKSSTEMVAPEIESPAPMQVTCPSCNNLLQVNDIGTTMNVTCPFCSTVLTIQSQKTPAEKLEPQMQPQPVAQPEIQPRQPMMQISCPKCLHKFSVVKTEGPIKVQCPNCGVSGTLG